MSNLILEQIESLTDASSEIIAKKISRLQAMQFWRDAWDTVSKEAIQNCWKKAKLREWQGIQSEFLDEESEITFNLPYEHDIIEQWIASDSELDTCAPATEDEIIREVTEKFQSDDQHEDEDDSFEVTLATCNEAKAAMEVISSSFKSILFIPFCLKYERLEG